MGLIELTLDAALQFIPTLTALALSIAGLAALNWVLRRRWKDDPDAQFRFQLIMLALTLAGVLAVVMTLPVTDTLRGQLLSLIGILLSAAIALSSTTFIGNIMAGIMLKLVRSARPGDFITVEHLTGRIAEMDLLHTQIQTEFRDLVTVPNLYMVTNPMQVLRASGTIISAEVSLGYDVAHSDAQQLLCRATERAELRDGFAHVRELGDFSVTYRAAGLLEDVTSLISARSRLREAVLDELHDAGIEIVSPNFMNTRSIADNERILPKPVLKGSQGEEEPEVQAEDIAFDVAKEAASTEEIRKSIESAEAELAEIPEDSRDSEDAKVARLETKIEKLKGRLAKAEEERAAAKLEE